MCELVQAYKSKDGTLHSTLTGCHIADAAYEKRLKEAAERRKLDTVRTTLAEVVGRHYYPVPNNYLIHESYYIEERGRGQAVEVLTQNWEEIRDALNKIPE